MMDCSGDSIVGTGVSSDKFYGQASAMQVRIEASLKHNTFTPKCKPPTFMTDILGPSRTWKVFRKQQDALNCARQRRNGLMCFTFEGSDGVRLFLAAHPKVFWFVYSNRPKEERRSYEIIQEHTVCKLYLDLEFEYEFNQNAIGAHMLNTFLHIVNINLWQHLKVKCDKDQIMVLDSSNSTKWSHHVVYELFGIAFPNNHVVGHFVKMICTTLKLALDDEDILRHTATEYELSCEDIKGLFVYDRKGKLRLFCDEGVYTKNRHFRLLGSSKFNKYTPLTVSPTNKYVTRNDNVELGMFLDSLVTYFSCEINHVLEFGPSKPNVKVETKHVYVDNKIKSTKSLDDEGSTFYSCVDTFIKTLIGGRGRVRKKIYFSSTCHLVYDICGFRYCENIQREHKSNNIKLVVDLNNLVWTQKCHDPDCVNFKSAPRPLPPHVRFMFDDDSALTDNTWLVDDLDLDCEFWKVAVNLNNNNQSVPDFGLSDVEMLTAVQYM